ncbi:hypothetical protein FRC0419_01568 [Corynebacterium diphtheriae]|nr:hypothetical protein FRC0419_01568 [Corynebacterium diphtheriae]
MFSIFRRFSAGVLASVIAAGVSISPAVAETSVDITAGDGGIVQKDCGTSPEYIRVDSASLPGSRACFFLINPTGWIALNITGSYGVVNELHVPVSVAFKLPDGDVYWQRIIKPGGVQNIDVDRHGSTVVELQVTPVATSSGAATGDLSTNSDETNVVSIRSAGRNAAGKIVRISWTGIELSQLDRNSAFNDRLDASFKVVPALDGSQCVSLEAAGYPGVYLTMQSNGTVSAQSSPSPRGATWCPSTVTETPTGTRLVSALNQTRFLATYGTQGVTTTTTQSPESVWFIDQALALPGK